MPRKQRRSLLHSEFGGNPPNHSGYQIPHELSMALHSMLASPHKTIKTPQLPGGKAISLRQRFYRWRTSVLDQFYDSLAPRHFRTSDCDKYLEEEVRGLNTDLLRRTIISMEPILSIRAELRSLIFSIPAPIEFMQILADGTLAPVNIAVEQLPTTKRTHVWDFGGGVTIPIEDTIKPAQPASDPNSPEMLEIHRRLDEFNRLPEEEKQKRIAAAKERDRLAARQTPAAPHTEPAPPSPTTDEDNVPQWVKDIRAANEKEKAFKP